MTFYLIAIIAVPLAVGLLSVVLGALLDSGRVSRMEEAEELEEIAAVVEAERIIREVRAR